MEGAREVTREVEREREEPRKEEPRKEEPQMETCTMLVPRVLNGQYITGKFSKVKKKVEKTCTCTDSRKGKIMTSHGIIAVSVKHNVPYIFLMKKRFTYSFVEYIFGEINTRDLLERELQFMTKSEKTKLTTMIFEDIWDEFWFNHKNKTYINSFKHTKEIHLQHIKENMDLFVKYLDVGPVDTKWEFPKGRRKRYETSYDCAVREFEEETQLKDQRMITIIDKTFIDNYVGTDGKRYRTFLFMSFCPTMDPVKHDFMNGLVSEEVSDAGWFPYMTAYSLLDDNKKKILRSANLMILFKKFPKLKLS